MPKLESIHNILLDRDGTLIEERHYLHDPEEVTLIDGIIAPMQSLARSGCRFFVVSNQSGIGRGMFSENEYHAVHARLQQLLKAHDIVLHGAAFCPHAPNQTCACRKPLIGMWQELVQKFELRPAESVMVGDKISDILFGLHAEMALTVLVRTGHGDIQARKIGLPELRHDVEFLEPSVMGWPHVQARSLTHFLNWFVQQKGLVHAHRI